MEDEEEESMRRHCGRAANQSFSFSWTGLASWRTRCVPWEPAWATVVMA